MTETVMPAQAGTRCHMQVQGGHWSRLRSMTGGEVGHRRGGQK